MKKLNNLAFMLLITLISINFVNAAANLSTPRTGTHPKIGVSPENYCVYINEIHAMYDSKNVTNFINELAETQKEVEKKMAQAKTLKEKEEAAKLAAMNDARAQLLSLIAKNIANEAAISTTKTSEREEAQRYQEAAQKIADIAKVTAQETAKAVLEK